MDIVRRLKPLLITLACLTSSPVVGDSVLDIISLEPHKTFYCGCTFEFNRNQRTAVKLSQCGYRPRLYSHNSRIQIEHVVPVSRLAKGLFCWRSGGRKACEGDSKFETMTADLHNLVPVISVINRDRSDLIFGIINGEPRQYGECDFEVDRARGVAEPSETIRGDIARIYFYMNERYLLKLDQNVLSLLEDWSRLDPVDDRERARNSRIAKIQGNANPFVAAYIEASPAFQ